MTDKKLKQLVEKFEVSMSEKDDGIFYMFNLYELEAFAKALQGDGVVTTIKNKRNTSGHVGVSWNKRAKKWKAYYTLDGEPRYIGLFANIEDAVIARNKAIAGVKQWSEK